MWGLKSFDRETECYCCGERFVLCDAEFVEEDGASVDGFTERYGTYRCPYCGSEEIA